MVVLVASPQSIYTFPTPVCSIAKLYFALFDDVASLTKNNISPVETPVIEIQSDGLVHTAGVTGI